MSSSPQNRQLIAIGMALLCATGMWLYVRRISVPRQMAEGARIERPRGNLSDLYPRWLGARELLLHGRDPYSREVTLEIQRGYYGRELDAARPNDPRDQNGFAYPVYVVFFLAPLVHMDFGEARILAIWFLTGCALLSVFLWELSLGIPVLRGRTLGVMFLLVGSYPFVEGVSLQQPILLVAALLAGSFLARQSGRLALSGVLLAVATIKPQVAFLPVILMVMWVCGDWRGRRRWLWGFGLAMLVLLGAGEYVLPGWVVRFYGAVRAYQSYMAGTSFLDWLVTPRWSGVAAALIVLPVVWVGWKVRRLPADSSGARRVLCLALAAVVCVSPNLALYNQVLLLPGLLFLFASPDADGGESEATPGSLVRALRFTVAGLLAWPWVAGAVLIVARYVFGAERFVQGFWQLPLYATLALPVFLLMLLLALSITVSSQRAFPLPKTLA